MPGDWTLTASALPANVIRSIEARASCISRNAVQATRNHLGRMPMAWEPAPRPERSVGAERHMAGHPRGGGARRYRVSRTMSRFLLTGSASLVALVAACSGGSAARGPVTPSSSASAALSAQPPTPTPQSSSIAPPPPATGTPRCHTTDLAVSLRQLNGGMGQVHAALDLTNLSGQPCQVYGYVGMLLMTGDRRTLPTRVVRAADPRPPVVKLAPGQTAFTKLQWTHFADAPDEQHPGDCQPEPALVQITPPDETTQLVAGWSLGPVCADGRISTDALAPGAGPVF